MRWLVLLLIIANLGVFFWFSVSAPENVRSVDEGRLPRVAEIELIGEQSGADSERRGSAMTQEQMPVQEREKEEGTDTGFVASAVESSKGAGPGRSAVAEESGAPAEPKVQPESSRQVVSPEQCFGLGPFEEEAHAEAYRRQLVREQVDVEFRGVTQREEPLDPFHWVIIPPLDSREAALARYRELVAQGIEAYVVPSGARANAISLGLFRSLRSAERVLERRQQQNINAILVKFPRNRISYALVFEGEPPASFDEFAGTSSQSGAGLQLIEFSDCEGVATAEKNP